MALVYLVVESTTRAIDSPKKDTYGVDGLCFGRVGIERWDRSGRSRLTGFHFRGNRTWQWPFLLALRLTCAMVKKPNIFFWGDAYIYTYIHIYTHIMHGTPHGSTFLQNIYIYV